MTLYSEIAEKLKKQIKSGTLPGGTQLPQEIEFASNLSITRKTLRNALDILEKENLIVRKKRIGTFIVDKAQDIVDVKYEICVAGDFGSSENKNLFISNLAGDGHATEALLAVQKLLGNNMRLSFISSADLAEIPTGIDGFIIVDSVRSANLLRKLANEKVPHISFETHLDYPGVNTVMADDAGAVRKTVAKLYKKGHKKIAFLGGAIKRPEINSGIRRRTEAFLSTCKELGIENECSIFNFDETIARASDFDILSKQTLSAPQRCSAVVCALGKGALSLLDCAERENIKIPQDMEMACIDSRTYDMTKNEVNRLKEYPGFLKPREKMADDGIQSLFEWIGNDKYKPECHLVPFKENHFGEIL
jgi:DNA-binding transcriptional regulator YhcF (GntR family)